jgi:O-antigen ligase
LTWYCYLLLAASVYCLGMACYQFVVSRDISVFFYHSLTRPISQNAVFYSVYVVFGLLFLLSPGGEPVSSRISPMGKRVLRLFLVFFFLGMIVLLSSKLMLVIAVLFLVNAFLRRYSYRKNKRVVLITGSALILAIGILALTKNPISVRYRELAAGDLDVIKQETFNPGMYFNALQLRLLEWRFGTEILNEQHAWLFGVSPGDSQDLLNEKYVLTHMYIGNPAEGPHRHIRGFIGYNFHNQYFETLVRSGFLGLATMLAIFILLFVRARKQGTREAWFVVLTLAVFFIPEAPLTLQPGVFLFCFFPLLAVNAPGKVGLRAE